MFPVMGGPAIPWSMIGPHERQAQINHDQTLERLAERGGLDPAEAVAVLQDTRFRSEDYKRLTPEQWRARLIELRDADLTAKLAASQAEWACLTERVRELERRREGELGALQNLAEEYNALARQLAEAPYRERLATCAYLIDRAGQYEGGSGYVAALEQAEAQISRGEHVAALEHGDLDDLLKRPFLRKILARLSAPAESASRSADDLVERTAEAAHNAWMTAVRANGVTSRLSPWGEECMVPFSGLSERAREFDRVIMRAILGVLRGPAPDESEPALDEAFRSAVTDPEIIAAAEQGRRDFDEGRVAASSSIDDLIARSSFGTPEAVALRAKTPPDVAARIVARSEELRPRNIVRRLRHLLQGEHEEAVAGGRTDRQYWPEQDDAVRTALRDADAYLAETSRDTNCD
jgi:polyhydroxyalkanoate synthesis regulator phasin